MGAVDVFDDIVESATRDLAVDSGPDGNGPIEVATHGISVV
ncbi:MAG: hypothetical protein ACTHN5_09340 [Phycisphaerae bacterium]